MGKGDSTSRKGKLFRKSYGNTRPRKEKKAEKKKQVLKINPE